MADFTPSRFGVLLREYRAAHGLTQVDLAKAAGASRRWVQDVECGSIAAPHRETIDALKRRLPLSEAERRAFDAATPRRVRAAPKPPAVRSNLPAPPTPLVGRSGQVAELGAALGCDGVRLLTLSGPAGVGKTRLALELGARFRGQGPFAGVWFVPLAPLADSAFVLEEIARVCGFVGRPDRPIVEILRETLGPARHLLILDNFEHLASAAVSVAELLAACPSLQVLATSRAPLHIRAERVVAVAPLALPLPGRPADPDDLAQVEAVALLVARLRMVRPSFAPTAANAADLAAVCRRLNGLPLAIELAAAPARDGDLGALLLRIDRPLLALTNGYVDLPERHRTLRNAIAWGYDLLPPGQRRVLRALSVLPGPFTADTAAAVGRGNEESGGRGEVGALMAALVDASLLQETDAPGPGRVRMLETVRDFGAERLAAEGETAAVHGLLLVWALDTAATAGRELLQSDPAGWLDALERDLPNLRAAIVWAVSADPASGLKLVSSLWQFWRVRGHWREGRDWLERGLAAAQASPIDPAIHADALNCLAILHADVDDRSSARGLYERSLELGRAAGDRKNVAEA